MSGELKKTLLEQLRHATQDRWKIARPRRHSDSDLILWLPVASLQPVPGDPTLTVGLSQNGTWVVASIDGSVLDLEVTGNYLPLFPLLEIPYEAARNALLEELHRNRIDQSWLVVFPFEQTVAAALKSVSKYWPDYALRWIPSLPISDVVREGLTLLEQKGRTQQQRHAARKLLRRLERRVL